MTPVVGSGTCCGVIPPTAAAGKSKPGGTGKSRNGPPMAPTPRGGSNTPTRRSAGPTSNGTGSVGPIPNNPVAVSIPLAAMSTVSNGVANGVAGSPADQTLAPHLRMFAAMRAIAR